MDYYNAFQKKRIKIWGHRTSFLTRGPNIGFMRNSIYKFRNDHIGRFDDAILPVYEAI